jgi:hypothetical protein
MANERLRTSDGFVLTRTGEGVWTDGDLAYPSDANGLPLDVFGHTIEGTLMSSTDTELEVELEKSSEMTLVQNRQYLVDYTVRNLTTGDGEEERVLELTEDEFDGFPLAVRDQVKKLVQTAAGGMVWTAPDHDARAARAAWEVAQDRVLGLLMPFISEREMYAKDYTAWERYVLGDDAMDAYPPESITDAVVKVLEFAQQAAVENWNEGYWEGLTTRSTQGDVLKMFVGFVSAWMEGADKDDPTFSDLLLKETTEENG